MRARTGIAVASLLVPLGAAAHIVPVGTEFQVNTFTENTQRYPAVAAGADGAFVVAWTNYQIQDGSILGVFGQRYDSVGQAVGTEFQVNGYTESSQSSPAVAAGADGSFVLVWHSEEDGSVTGVFGQRYDSAGQAVGTEFQVNTYTPSYQDSPAVAAGADGAFLVAWSSFRDGSISGIFGQRYDSAGQAVGTEFQVNSYTFGPQSRAAVAAGADGTFVVAWTSYQNQDGSSEGVFGQRYDSAGQAVGTEFQVNTYTRSYQSAPAVAAGADGGFVVVWSGHRDGSSTGVFGQRYDSAGQAVGTQFQVNTYTQDLQVVPAVAAGVDGAFVVAWTSFENQDGSGRGVFGQRYDSLGQAVGTEFQVNGYTVGYQSSPAVAAGADGGFVVAWSSYQDGDSFGVFGQRFAVLAVCAGDCDRDGTPSIDELITGVAIALDQLPIQDCDAFDIDESGQITIDELVAAVDAALHGCTE